MHRARTISSQVAKSLRTWLVHGGTAWDCSKQTASLGQRKGPSRARQLTLSQSCQTDNDRAGTHAGTPKAVAAAPYLNTQGRDFVAASKEGPLRQRRPSRDSVRGTCRDWQR